MMRLVDDDVREVVVRKPLQPLLAEGLDAADDGVVPGAKAGLLRLLLGYGHTREALVLVGCLVKKLGAVGED